MWHLGSILKRKVYGRKDKISYILMDDRKMLFKYWEYQVTWDH
jgi:hypothetical protein